MKIANMYIYICKHMYIKQLENIYNFRNTWNIMKSNYSSMP